MQPENPAGALLQNRRARGCRRGNQLLRLAPGKPLFRKLIFVGCSLHRFTSSRVCVKMDTSAAAGKMHLPGSGNVPGKVPGAGRGETYDKTTAWR